MNTFYFIAASRGRPNKSGKWIQTLEIGGGDSAHALTTVQKDNLIVEIMAESPEQAEQKIEKIKQMIKGEFKNDDGLIVPVNSFAGYTIGHHGDGFDITFPGSDDRRGRVQKSISHTLVTGGQNFVIVKVRTDSKLRVRRFTPRERWRLMGFDDSDYDRRAAVCSERQLYKQAGNSIVVNVLMAVFNQLTENADLSGENVSLFNVPNYQIKKPIRLIELFAGIGSQAKRLENLGMNFERYRVIEWDKYCIRAYNAIHGTNFETRDISETSGDDLGIVETDKYDYIVTYSFPCQDLSGRGNRRGMKKGDGTRSGLLWQVERLLTESKEKPQILVMENVPNVHNDRNKNDFDSWVRRLEKFGYSNYWSDLNSKNYGVPQNRERCFMVSILGDYDFIFPRGEQLRVKLSDLLEPSADGKYYIADEKLTRIIKQMENAGESYRKKRSKK